MKYTIQNNTNKNQSTLQQMVGDYFPYARKEMGFDMPVTIIFESDIENAKNPLGKTAYYDPSNHTVVLYTDGRHPKDIMRSLSHELVHHKQNCNGELEGVTGEQGYAQTESGHRIEEEAYSLGNTCFRNWEDGVKKRTNETTYFKRRILNMNEDKLRMAIRKVIEESPAFKKHFKGKETPIESTEASDVNPDNPELKEEENASKKPDGDGDGVPQWADKDGDNPEVQEEAAELEEEEEKPLKEWYDNSLYKKLLKESTRRKK